MNLFRYNKTQKIATCTKVALGILILSSQAFTQTTTTQPTNCKKNATVPYAQQIKAAQITPTMKQSIMKSWGSMYAAYLAKSATTAKNGPEWQGLKTKSFINNPFCSYTPLGQSPDKLQKLQLCLDPATKNETSDVASCQTNIQNAYDAVTQNSFQDMATYLSPTTLKKIKGDKTGYLYNYATTHIRKTAERLAQVYTVSHDNYEPKVTFTGDMKDLGVIVNVSNNSDTTFGIAQHDGTAPTFIGTLTPGFNGPNLHTAALQAGVTEPKSATPQTSELQTESNYFAFYPLAPSTGQPTSNEPLFTVKVLSGAQLKTFLETVSHDTQTNTFMMNGRPTSPQHLAIDTNLYMVLIQNPAPA